MTRSTWAIVILGAAVAGFVAQVIHPPLPRGPRLPQCAFRQGRNEQRNTCGARRVQHTCAGRNIHQEEKMNSKKRTADSTKIRDLGDVNRLGATFGKTATLLTPAEVAQLLGVTVGWLASARCSGYGPPFVKFHRGRQGNVRYALAAVEAWIAEHTQKSTSDTE